MDKFNVKCVLVNVWIICEGDDKAGCAGEWDSESDAQGVADMLNEAAQ